MPNQRSNEILNAIFERRTVREFLSSPISPEEIETIIKAGCFAPSAENRQPWRLSVITSREKKKALASAIRDRLSKKFPVQILEKHPYLMLSQFENMACIIAISKSWDKWNKFIEKVPFDGWAGFNDPVANVFIEVGTKFWPEVKSKVEIECRSYVQWISTLIEDALSIGACIQNMCLAAQALGYATAWLTTPVTAGKLVEEIFNCKKDTVIMSLLGIGKPVKIPSPPPRKSFNEILMWEEE